MATGGVTPKGSKLGAQQVALASGTQTRAQQATLTQHIMKHSGDPKLALLLNAIQHACKVIANAISKAAAQGLQGEVGDTIFTGDDVKVLDILSNDVFIAALQGTGVCSV